MATTRAALTDADIRTLVKGFSDDERAVRDLFRNAEGELIAELLDVTHVPTMLASAPDEIAVAACTLRKRVSLRPSPLLGRHQ